MDKVSEPRATTSQTPTTNNPTYTQNIDSPGLHCLTLITHVKIVNHFGILVLNACTLYPLIHLSLVLIEFYPLYPTMV